MHMNNLLKKPYNKIIKYNSHIHYNEIIKTYTYIRKDPPYTLGVISDQQYKLSIHWAKNNNIHTKYNAYYC